MKIRFLVFIGILLGLSSCTAAKAPAPTTQPSPTPTALPSPTPVPPGPFDYDPAVPFDTKVLSETDRDGVTVLDLTYATHDPSFSTTTGGRTVAYLVKPEGEGPFAGVIFLHWLGVVSGNRNEYLDEAVELARHGVVSLVPQGFFPWMSFPMGTEVDHQLTVAQVIELRRAVDFLLSQGNVDLARLGFIGHDYGAMYGSLLAGVDPRLKTFILVAGTPSFVDFGLLFGFKQDAYEAVMGDLAPAGFVAKADPASLLFQFGHQDAAVPEDKANQFFEAASQPKKVEWYADMHNMESAEARQARLDWLVDKLGLNP